jgi:hypothetical protein
MILDHITFTGPDDKTNPEELYALSQQYPQIEWGILWYSKKMGQPRYPTLEWVNNFFENKPENVNTSLHICGTDCWQWFIPYSSVNTLIEYFAIDLKRIQLNMPFVTKTPEEYVFWLDYFFNKGVYAGILQFKEKRDGKVIIQAKKSNKVLKACLEDHPAVEILYDESGGKGEWIMNSAYDLSTKPPYEGKLTGYAGGINPINVHSTLTFLSRHYCEDSQIWIDMETGVRTDNEFDLHKVKSVLKQVWG